MLDYIDARDIADVLPDLEPLTYCVRTSALLSGSSDTFTNYTLYQAKRRPATRQEINAAGLLLSDEVVTFILVQRDLDAQVGYQAQPYATYQLIDQAAGVVTGNTASGNNVVSGLSSTSGLLPGMGVVGTGITPGSIIQAVGSGQITLNQPATANGIGVSLTIGVAWEIKHIDRDATRAGWNCVCTRAR